MFKNIFTIMSLLFVVVISGCVKENKLHNLEVNKNCKGLVCSLTVQEKTLQRTTNILGVSTDKVIKTTPLTDYKSSNIKWTPSDNATLADNNSLPALGLPKCLNDDGSNKCTDSGNPTAYQFPKTGQTSIHVKGVLTKNSGLKEYIDQDVALNIKMDASLAEIDAVHTEGNNLEYKFSIDGNQSGIPLGDSSTYKWYINGTQVSSDEKTSYTFPVNRLQDEIKVVINPKDKNIGSVTLAKELLINIKPASINYNLIKGTKYTLTADTTDKGLPSSGVTYKWGVDGRDIRDDSGIVTSSSIDYLFPEGNKTYKVSLETFVDGISAGSTTKDITTVNAIQPTLSKPAQPTQDGGTSPIIWTISVTNISDTNIDNTWKQQWFIDDGKNPVITVTADELRAYQFALTNQEYNIKYVATNKHGVERTASTTVTTGAAKEPNLNENLVNGYDFRYRLSADLTNTGITDKWTFKWESNRPEQTDFVNNDSESKDVIVDTTAGDRSYSFTFTATPPVGSNDTAKEKSFSFRTSKPQKATIETPVLVSGITYKLTANTTDKGLNNIYIEYEWKIDDGDAVSGQTINHDFSQGSHKIELITKNGDTEIGTDTLTFNPSA